MKDQDKIEFLKLYQPVHEQFCRFCRFISGNTEDAEDLVHDSVLSVLESFEKIKDKSAFKSYLFSVAGNLNKMRFRKRKFKAIFDEKEYNKIIDVGQNQEYIVEFGLIYDKILSLPAKISEALILFHISDLSLEEIQKIQGGSLSGVKLRLKRGREKLLSSLSSPAELKMALIFFTF
ncbi:MAG: RNA polymerase sigma factor [Bacteroidales bacterium]